MNSELITYLTTTFNRRDDLSRLFVSLENQTVKNFLWLVIDDGSTDKTDELVKTLQKKASFSVIYKYEKNGGKHRALNHAFEYLKTPLTMVIDSDDILLNNCSEVISLYWQKYKNNPKIGSFIFEHGRTSSRDPMEKINGTFIAPRFEFTEKNKKFGDFNDVFFTKFLKDFRFPEFEGENFIAETPLYYEFSKKHESLFIGKVIAVGNYKEGGLTSQIRQLKINNYKGAMFELNECMRPCFSLYSILKHATLYDYVVLGNRLPICKSTMKSSRPILTLMLIIPAYIFLKLDEKRGKVVIKK